MSLPDELLASLTDFQAWKRDDPDFDLVDYAFSVATPDLLFGFAELLCPSLVLHDGSYFWAGRFNSKYYADWMDKLRDPVAVQKVMNHRHISSLFQQQDVSDLVAREAAHRIAACWRLTPADKGLTADAYGETFLDAEVTFFRS